MTEDDLSLKSIVYLMKRQSKLAFSVALLVSALTVVYILALPAVYSTTALVQISPDQSSILSEETGPQNFGINNARVEGELEILKSAAVVQRVVQSARLLHDAEFGFDRAKTDLSAPFMMSQTIQNFQAASAASRNELTYLITARVTSTSPERAAELANLWVESYLAHQVEAKVNDISKVAKIISTRLFQAQQMLEQAERQIDIYIAENLTLISNFSGNSEIETLNARLLALGQELEEVQNQRDQMTADIQNQDWQSINTQLRSETLSLLATNRIDLQAELQNTQLDAAELQNRINLITGDMTRETESHMVGLSAQLDGLTLQTSRLRQQIRTLIQGSDLPPEIVAHLYVLQQKSNIARVEYDTILARQQELNLLADLQVPHATLVSPALPPLQQSTKNKQLIFATGLAIAAALAMLSAFLAENWIGGFNSAHQLERKLALRVAARIPELTKKQLTTGNIADRVLVSTKSQYAESIRRLRVSIDQALARNSPETGGKIIMIASSIPGEGKSNISLALGRVYAASGLRTLLIDCDFRRPKIHKLMNFDAANAVFDKLNVNPSSIDLNNIAIHADNSGLNAIIGHTDGLTLTDQVLADPNFKALLETAKSQYDIIILDTAPLLPIIDAAHLAKTADVIALTVKWAKTRQEQVKESLKILTESKKDSTEIVAILSQEKSSLENHGAAGDYYTE